MTYRLKIENFLSFILTNLNHHEIQNYISKEDSTLILFSKLLKDIFEYKKETSNDKIRFTFINNNPVYEEVQKIVMRLLEGYRNFVDEDDKYEFIEYNLNNLITAHERLIDDHNIPVMWTKKIYLFYNTDRNKNPFILDTECYDILYEIVDLLVLMKVKKQENKNIIK